MNRMSFEELFRKHLSDYREAPRPEVWARLSRRLEARKRRRRLVWWMSTASLLVGLTAFTLWLRHESQGRQISKGLSVPSSSPLPEVQIRENSHPRNFMALNIKEPEDQKPTSEQATVSNPTQTAEKSRHWPSGNSGKHPFRYKDNQTENLMNEGKILHQPTVMTDGSTQALAEKNVSQTEPADRLKSEETNKFFEPTTENALKTESEIQQPEKTTRHLPIFIGLSYEAGSLWRLSPVSASPGFWMPAENMETLPGSKGTKATSFSDVAQAIQFTAGYRFSEVLSVHLSLGHTRIRHFESGNLLNRALPSGGELGLMTGTGAFRVGGEAVSDTSVVLRKLSQHFSFVSLSPGVTYNLHLRQWVLGFNAGVQLHLLAGNRAEATFAHTVHTYRHEGLRPFNASLTAGVSVGYRIQRLTVAAGFQGGYWTMPLSRRGFAGARYLQMGIRPAVIYNF